MRIVGMLDDVALLFRHLGSLNCVNLKCETYNGLVLEFLSSLSIYEAGSYKRKEALTKCQTFNNEIKLTLRDFSRLLYLLIHGRAYKDVPGTWKAVLIWLSMTCAKRKVYYDRWGQP